MIKSIGKLTLVTLLAAMALGVPVRVSAQTNATTPAKPAPSKKGLPYHGKLASVDNVAKTITLEGKTKHTFEITSETKMIKNGKPATLSDAVVGEDVGVYYTSTGGKMVAKSVRFGAKPTPATTTPPAPAAAPAAPKQ